MRGLPATVSAAAVVLTLAAPAGAKIVIGKSIAGVKLGDSAAAVKRKLGAPEVVMKGMNGYRVFNYKHRKLLVAIRKHDGVVELTTFNAHERTSKGIGVGSSFAAVKKAYPGACPYLKVQPHCAIEQNVTSTQFSASNFGHPVDTVKIQSLKKPG